MAEVIELKKNEMGYSHIVCTKCNNNNTFHVRTSEDDTPVFESLNCAECGNDVFVGLQPVWEDE